MIWVDPCELKGRFLANSLTPACRHKQSRLCHSCQMSPKSSSSDKTRHTTCSFCKSSTRLGPHRLTRSTTSPSSNSSVAATAEQQSSCTTIGETTSFLSLHQIHSHSVGAVYAWICVLAGHVVLAYRPDSPAVHHRSGAPAQALMTLIDKTVSM